MFTVLADFVIFVCNVSTGTCCSACNSGFGRDGFIEASLLAVGAVDSVAAIFLCKISNWCRDRIARLCACGSCVMSLDMAVVGSAVVGKGDWQESVRQIGVLPVNLCTCTLYVFIRCYKYRSRSV